MEATLTQLATLLLKTLFETEGLLTILTAACLVLSLVSVFLWWLMRGLTKTMTGLTVTVDTLGLKVNGLVTRDDLNDLSDEFVEGLNTVDSRCHDLSVRLARLEGVCEANTNYQGPRRRASDLA